MKPELSIVIAIRDNWQQLGECLASIAAQHGPPCLEIVVIDDGSTTAPPSKIAESTSQMPVRILCQTGLGIGAARNRGIRLAYGEVILFIDSDCLLDSNCLQNLVEATRRHIDDVAFQLLLSSPEKNLAQRIESLRLRTVQQSLLLESGHILYANTSGFAARSSYVAESEDFFDVGVLRGSDTLVLAQLIGQGRKPRFLPECNVFHCPKMSFWKYALKHYYIGYHGSYSHRQLWASAEVLLGWRKKFQIMRRALSEDWFNSKRVLCACSAFLCLSIEKFGGALSRLFAIGPGKRKLLSVRMDAVRRTELIYCIATKAERACGLLVSYANAWTLVQAQESDRFLSLLNTVDICYVDGAGVKLAAILLNQPRVRKVTANDFIFDLCRELANRNLTVALIGSQKSVLRRASQIISKAAPDLDVVLQSPGFFSQADEESLTAELLKRKPNVVLIGMGQPRQEEWAAKIRPLLPGSVLLCVGGLFDYLAGRRKKADFARRLNLEWAFRFCFSPRQTARRYLYGIPALFGYILVEHVKRVSRFCGSKYYKPKVDRRGKSKLSPFQY